ncbi:hypothetical protein [Streptomyces sp. NPDC046862]|uniref:hypothetical protein n=1 Tax=Streptomyces sp. NPDC046862 TaxID=3154603 RepID=UPI003451B6FB
MPSISRANVAHGESGRSPECEPSGLGDGEEVFAELSVFVLSAFDEQLESAATVATIPPESMVLRSGCPTLPICFSFRSARLVFVFECVRVRRHGDDDD